MKLTKAAGKRLKRKQRISKNISQFLNDDNKFSRFAFCFINLQLAFLWLRFPTGNFNVFELDSAYKFSDQLPTFLELHNSSFLLRLSADVSFVLSVTFFVNKFISIHIFNSGDQEINRESLKNIQRQLHHTGIIIFKALLSL